MKISLIDLGSNSARMYVTEINENSYNILSKHRVMTKLSEGMGSEKILKEIPISRTIDVLKNFADLSEKEESTILATATAAVRLAKNKDEFTEKVFNETNIKLNVISGETEAKLDFEGVLFGFPDIQDCLITDTGGGSTEIIYVKNREIQNKISLPFGAVSLKEKFDNISDAEKAVEEELCKIEFLKDACNIPIIGLGGSISAIAAVDINIKNKKCNIHNYKIDKNELSDLYKSITKMSYDELIKLKVEKERTDTISFGCLPTYIISNYLDCPNLYISTFGLREGIISKIISNFSLVDINNMEQFLENIV